LQYFHTFYHKTSVLSVAVAHALLLGFTGTCSLILALLGIEGVTDRDVQTMATASCFLHSVEEATVLSYILYATLEHITDAGTFVIALAKTQP